MKMKLFAACGAASLLSICLLVTTSSAASAAASSVAHRPSKMYLSSKPKGAMKERLPKTSESVTVIGGGPGSTSVITEKPGSSQTQFSSQAVGSATQKWPYSTSRVAVQALGPSDSVKKTPVTSRPYRLTGKLQMRFGSDWFVCTASLIKKNVLITAAHCVHDFGLGNAGFADEVIWTPATISNPDLFVQPFGQFTAKEWRVPSTYHDGTDTCQTGSSGVVCNNDLATVVLNPQAGVSAQSKLGGTYGYGWNGFSSIKSPAFGNVTVSDITQLGYPAAFDSGFQMQRNNSFGKTIISTGSNGRALKQIQLGSAMTGGSSGGPWLVNFGTTPSIDATEASLGTASLLNTVVGVTSWGLTAVGANVQGSSMFGQNFEFPNADYGGRGAGNIGFLVNETCNANPGAC